MTRLMHRAQRGRQTVTSVAVLLAILPALAALVQPGVASAQVTSTQVVLASAPGDAWIDDSGNFGSAVCAAGTEFSGTCSSSP